MEEYAVQFYLLRSQPQILIHGEPLTIGQQALKLLIYLAESDETDHAREELIRLIYGTELARETFRKKVIYPIRKLIPDAPLETVQGDVIHFTRENIWVDSRAFADQASSLLQIYPRFKKPDYEAAKQVLDLYEDPFLADYHPKAGDSVDDTRFLAWQKGRQQDLAALYHRLLDRTTAFCLDQQRYWAEAQHYAERWLRSQNSSAKPLQYLIWLAARQRSDSLQTYLAQLRAREEAGELPMGLSWTEWDRLLKSGRSISLSLLFPQTEPPTETPVEASAGEHIYRQGILEQIMTLLTATSQQVFAVTGLPGVGKTELAHAAAGLLRERQPSLQVVFLELTAQLDLELLCNNLLSDLGRQDLFKLDYARKRQRLKQLLQAPNLVVIVDEGHTTHLADLDTLNTVLALLSGARVMLVARKLPRFEHYVIEVQGLDEEQTRHFLVSRVAWLKEIEATKFREIADLTGGLPLLLHIIAGGLKKELGRVHSLVDHLKVSGAAPETAPDIYARYEGVLSWLWQYLDSKDKDLLYSLSLFAPEEGARADDLKVVLENVFPAERLLSKINRLVDLHLAENRDAGGRSADAHYRLHPIIFDYVQRQTRHPRRAYAQIIEQSYIRHLLDFTAAHSDQFDRLDEHKQNIFRMLDLVIGGDAHPWARRQAVEVLNQIYPYFELRGLHEVASRLIGRARELHDIEDVSTHIQLTRRAARLASIRAEDEQAQRLYEEALARAKQANDTRQYAPLYHDIGNVHLQKGRFSEAIRCFELAEREAGSEQPPYLRYSIWSNLGVSAYRQGQYQDALRHYQKVIDHLGGDTSNLPPELLNIAEFVHTAMGSTLNELGQYEQAKACFQRGLALARQLNYPERLGFSYLNLGVSYYHMKDYHAAYDCFVQGGIIADQIQHVALRTQILWNQGSLASARFQHKEALSLLRSALIEVENNDLMWLKPRILIGLGKAYLRAEHHDSARQCFTEALSLRQILAKHAAQGLYGLGLSVMLKAYVVGNNDVEITLDLLQPYLELLPVSALPLNDIEPNLAPAGDLFQQDLDHLPQLERYRIVEALLIWLSSLQPA